MTTPYEPTPAAKARDLRRRGFTYREIAKHLGVSPHRAYVMAQVVL